MSAIAFVSSSHSSGLGLPPRRKVVLRPMIPCSPQCFSASTVFSRSRGRNDTHSRPRMRSVLPAASITTGLSEKGCSGLGMP